MFDISRKNPAVQLMNTFRAALTGIAVCLFLLPSFAGAQEPLRVYFLDMMGGASTLIVSPTGESVLIDTGSRQPEHRDADRIMQAVQHAGLEKIDYLITTHFHLDHFGGIHELSQRIPILNFIDKGHLPPETDEAWFKTLYPLYLEATKGQAKPMKAGDELILAGSPDGLVPQVRLRCVAAEKQVVGFEGDIDAPVPGHEMRDPDHSDNARSIALVITYGDFDMFVGGDITWNVEHHLALPENRIGVVDLYQVTHHGLDQSNNPVLLRALDPTVAVSMNGPRKGVQPRTFETIQSLPHLQALYQMHFNSSYGTEGNTETEFIANRENPDAGNFILARVQGDRFSISIGPEGKEHFYPLR